MHENGITGRYQGFGGPLSLGFSGIGSTLCREVANFACKFQSISSKRGVPWYFKGSDSSFPPSSLLLSIILAHILLLAPEYQLDRQWNSITHLLTLCKCTLSPRCCCGYPPPNYSASPSSLPKHLKIMRGGVWEYVRQCACMCIITFLRSCPPTRL